MIHRSRLCLGLCLLLLPLAGCGEDAPRQRDGADAMITPDMDLDPADGGIDAGQDAADLPDEGPMMADMDPGADMAMPDAELPDMGPPPPPEECNGLDEDSDGIIDEGVSNLCGGCGGIPPEGCQSWKVSLIQGPDSQADIRRFISQQVGVLGVSEREVENATCRFARFPFTDPDAHLGQVTVTSPQVEIVRDPVFDQRVGLHRYETDPAPDPVRVFNPGEVVEVSAEGGTLMPPFMTEVSAPDVLNGVGPNTLADLIQMARGTVVDPIEITWAPARQPEWAGTMRIFVGGSRPIFNRNVYRGFQSYTLNVVPVDDGRFTVTPDLLAPAVPGSAVRARVARDITRRAILGPHSVELEAGYEAEEVRSGELDAQDPPPFDIITPDPDTRTVVPGDPLVVSWSPLPEGAGPLAVELQLVDSALREIRSVSCEILDPSTGAFTLPADVTEGWPQAEGDTRLLVLSYVVSNQTIPAPDQGRVVHRLSVQLRLEP